MPPLLADIEMYAERTSSRLLYLSLNLVALSTPELDEIFSHLGKAIGLSTLLASLPHSAGFTAQSQAPIPQSGRASRSALSTQRRLALPREYAHAHGVVEEEVYRLGPQAPGLTDAVFDTATRANDYLISARTAIAQLDGGKLPELALGPLMNAVRRVAPERRCASLTPSRRSRHATISLASRRRSSTSLTHRCSCTRRAAAGGCRGRWCGPNGGAVYDCNATCGHGERPIRVEMERADAWRSAGAVSPLSVRSQGRSRACMSLAASQAHVAGRFGYVGGAAAGTAFFIAALPSSQRPAAESGWPDYAASAISCLRFNSAS